MQAFVIIATKGRAKETYTLLDYMARQSLSAKHIWVVGSEAKDIAGLGEHPLTQAGSATLLLGRPGLTLQRNVGLEAMQPMAAEQAPADWLVAFFDDDFRPAVDWLEQAAKAMQADAKIAGITGNVLADGVKTEFGISEQEASAYLEGRKQPEAHWSSAQRARVLDGLYGCNMAYRGTVAQQSRFDENLPIYGWQEDTDYSSRARQFGQMLLLPACTGVHLGSSAGRTSGVRFGYSQISNPIFLARKGTMTWSRAGRLMAKNMLANVGKTLLREQIKDFPGRLRGNALAFTHLLAGKLNPLNVLKID